MAAAPLGAAAAGVLLVVPHPPASASLLPLPLAPLASPSSPLTASAAPAISSLQLAHPLAADQPTAATAIRALSAALLLAAAAASSSSAGGSASAHSSYDADEAVTPHRAAEQPALRPSSMHRHTSVDARTESAESSAAGAAAAALQAQSSAMSDAASPPRRISLLALPAELLHLIFSHLLPRADSSVYPAASWATLPPTHAFIHLGAPQALRPLLALSLVCRTTSAVALPLLYAAPTLERTRQARLLARTLALSPSSATLAHAIRHLIFPQDGLLYASDQLADQQAWATSLGAIFKAARSLRSVWITARPQGCSLAAFLAPGVAARPSRMTINSFSPSPVPLHEFDLSPLTQVTHLHLIQVLPAPELLALFAGQAQPAAPQKREASTAVQAAPGSYAAIAAAGQRAMPASSEAEGRAGRTSSLASPPTAATAASPAIVLPQPPLTHLRLSSLPPFTLHDFAEYVTYRRALAAHAALPASVALQSNPPSAPARTTSSALKAQAALYELALCVRRMPALRRLTLELSSLGTLDEPEWAMQPSLSATAILDGTGGPGSPYEASTGQLATLDFPADVPVTLAEAREWAVRETENARANERSRTAPRDAYWLDVRMGLEALRELVAQASEREEVEVRLCAARPGGWDRHEARAESAAMVAAASAASSSSSKLLNHAGSPSARAARRVSAEKTEAYYARARASVDGKPSSHAMQAQQDAAADNSDDDGTSFSDPDIFELAETRPLLGYQSSTASRRGSAALSAAAHMSTAMAASSSRPSSGDENADRRTTLWWTGELPRINSGRD